MSDAREMISTTAACLADKQLRERTWIGEMKEPVKNLTPHIRRKSSADRALLCKAG